MQSLIEGTIILIDKPLHWSSFQAVNKLKWAIMKKYHLKKFKIGHAGTLDPLATGLLILCTGKHTKLISSLQDAPKTYTGTIALGATTPSYDLETEIDARFATSHITEELIEQVRMQFTGTLLQAPPLFSAIKKDGKRLYELARKGEVTEIPEREITIHSLALTPSGENILSFEVHCSKGTYIRSLANDFGKALGSGGYLSALRRTKIGDFSVSNAISPEKFVSAHIPDLRKHPLPPIILTTVVGEPQEKKVLNDRFANRNKTINSQFEREETPPSHPIGELNMEAIFPRRKAQKTSGLQYELRAFMRMFTNTDKAITITLLILFCTVLTLMVIQLSDKKKEIMIEMALTPDDLPQEPPQPEETSPNADVPTNNAKLTTNAYNQADASLQHTDDFKTLDEIMAERAAQEMAAAKEELVANQKMAGDLIITDHSLQNTTNTPKISDKVNKNTLVKYALAGRVGNIPNPVFTCERDGKVVVSITVDEAGRVTKTAIDRANSTTTDDCLLENSLLYAQKAKFNAVSGKKEQTGTITYIFQSKR